MENSKIALLRWESGKIPEPLMQLETLPGNSTNLDSYPFPVRLVEVKGANMDTVLFNPSQKLLEDMIQISKDLYNEGVRAITTSRRRNRWFGRIGHFFPAVSQVNADTASNTRPVHTCQPSHPIRTEARIPAEKDSAAVANTRILSPPPSMVWFIIPKSVAAIKCQRRRKDPYILCDAPYFLH